MPQGFIYILTNEAMPNVVKVGKTTKEPSSRATQLSAATGVPTRFSLFRCYEVTDCGDAEKYTHRILERIFGRPNSQREFFSAAADDVAVILGEALQPFLVREEPSTTNDILLGPILRLERKEFTFAKLEFEELFRTLDLNENKIANSATLQRAAGAYLACCFALDKAPAHRCILGTHIKSKVMELAIRFVAEFHDDPVMPLIEFVRRID